MQGTHLETTKDWQEYFINRVRSLERFFYASYGLRGLFASSDLDVRVDKLILRAESEWYGHLRLLCAEGKMPDLYSGSKEMVRKVRRAKTSFNFMWHKCANRSLIRESGIRFLGEALEHILEI